jgi:predicted nucleic acid-binding protein
MTGRVVFDASFLAALTDETTPVRAVTGGTPDDTRDRLAYLIERLDDGGADIVIPTPALAEVLSVATRDPSAALATLDAQARFRVVPFDQRAATECGIRIRDGLRGRDSGQTTRPAVKFDSMILAVAIVEQATAIYTDDDALRGRARAAGLRAYGFDDLPARPTPPQGELPMPAPPAPKAAAGRPARRRPRQ